MLEIYCDTKKTVITVANWDKYQHAIENQRHRCDTAATPIGTIKNGKNEKNYKNKESTTLESTADKPPPRTRFTVPSLDEVSAYCRERNNDVDAQRFIDYYTSNGWHVGKNSMKDWKAAVRNWEKRSASDKPGDFEVNAVRNMMKHRIASTSNRALTEFELDALQRMEKYD
jgi:hypothetical protein